MVQYRLQILLKTTTINIGMEEFELDKLINEVGFDIVKLNVVVTGLEAPLRLRIHDVPKSTLNRGRIY